MASHFDITATTTALSLDESRNGRGSFTVTNTGTDAIGGEALVVAAPGTPNDWFSIPRPSRSYPPGHTEQLSVEISVPADVPAGSHAFRLRMLMAGGIPEEDFDDGPLVRFDVVAVPPPPPPPEPVRRPFPWRIAAVIGVVIVGVVGAVAIVLLNEEEPGRLVFRSDNNGTGAIVCDLAAREGDYRMDESEGCTDGAARSLVLEGIPASTRIDVYGSPSCSTSTDWAEIRTQEAVVAHIVGTFEADSDGPPVSVDYRTPTGPWLDIADQVAVDPERVVAVGDGSTRSESGIEAFSNEVERAGGSVLASEVGATELTTGRFDALLEEAVVNGADTVVVDASSISSELREELAEVASRFEGIDVLWPGTSSPEGLDGRVSCVRVSRERA